MKTLRDLHVVRAAQPSPELRADSDAESDVLGVLSGHFSMFDNLYRIDSWWEGSFMERVAPGAFRKTMAERRNSIVVAYDHGYDPVIGDKVLGPIRDLREDGQGAYYEVDLLDTSYARDLAPALKRGLYGSSFRFQVIRDEWDQEPGDTDDNPDGLPIRTIKEVRLFEFGPVTYPANPAATAGLRGNSGGVLGTTDNFYARMRGVDPARVASLEARVRELRTLPPADEPGSVAPSTTPDAPDLQVHPSGLSAAVRHRLLSAPFLTYGSSSESEGAPGRH